MYVYGSCVARDTVAALPAGSYTLAGYTARHSVLSEGSDASEKLPASLGLNSAFQERMVRDDWAGTPLRQLFQRAETIDIFLWDLTDERHGVHWFMSGEIITRSIDLIHSQPALEALEPHTHVTFGSDEHFEGWSEKVTNFVHRLDDAGLLERTRLLRINWAETTPDGQPTPASMGLSATQANRLYTRYYEHLAAAGVRTITVPADITYADPNHRWGLAPFHYAPEVYQYVINQLRAEGYRI
ncbi:DUF6270 domain-containing protein [Rothia nasimurium]|uniref:DUF6270 domain-containing protein n=1 Tax=Rothia nasimurium TaxID=85336 RepID=UPI002351C088|nr:DUF6270 domain-containing protein [Rothia nasimurium]